MKKFLKGKAFKCLLIFLAIRIVLMPFCGGIFWGVFAMLKINNYSLQSYDQIHWQPAATYDFMYSYVTPRYSMAGISYYPQSNSIWDSAALDRWVKSLRDSIRRVSRRFSVQIDLSPTRYDIAATGQYGEDLQYSQAISIYIRDDLSDTSAEQGAEDFSRIAYALMERIGSKCRLEELKMYYTCADNNYLLHLEAGKNALLDDYSFQTLASCIKYIK